MTATRYEVSCLPVDHRERRHFTLTVEYRGRGLWAVSDGFEVLGKDGTWDHEPLSSSREEDWIAAHRFDLDTALEIAKKAAPHITINGFTVEKVLADIAAREAAERPGTTRNDPEQLGGGR
ncbi:hypothetical protein [Sphaerisporangium melleum]|uniref:hypothetical protein n=1 Tax=Sphaerisporangium melleum TaxID=321316 RepID=UPI00166A4B1E|nr:hypothetical protein [Sphaerisporangium melleum]